MKVEMLGEWWLYLKRRRGRDIVIIHIVTCKNIRVVIKK